MTVDIVILVVFWSADILDDAVEIDANNTVHVMQC